MFRCGSRRLLLLLSLLLVACPGPDGGDPLSSLAEAQVSTRYDVAYWAEQQHRGTEAWRNARAYCQGKDERERPNCTSIRLVGWLETPPSLLSLEPPAYTFHGNPALDTAYAEQLEGRR